jgi:hypothetical protein
MIRLKYISLSTVMLSISLFFLFTYISFMNLTLVNSSTSFVVIDCELTETLINKKKVIYYNVSFLSNVNKKAFNLQDFQ